MKQDGKEQKRQGKNGKKLQLYKPRKKKSVEEDAAIQYLQAQYDKVLNCIFSIYLLFHPLSL